MLEASQIEEVTQIRMGREMEGRVLYWVAVHLVDGLLIETGCRHTAEELAEFLEGKYLKLAVNTHHHEDHIGANRILMERFGIRIFASRESIPFISRVPRMPPYREVVWGYPEPTEVEPLPERIETDHFRFDVVDIPGHCDGHVALVEPTRGWCFSGDLFISQEPMAVRPEDDIAETVQSMRKLIDLKVEKLILFTSAGKVVEDGREALQSCIEYYRDLSQRAKQLERQGLSVGDIRDRIFGRETSLAGPTGGDFSAENMIRAVLRAEL
jgi:glyoxylase-like metal-dependent hydrolase (beta-lactamase superfamily II)